MKEKSEDSYLDEVDTYRGVFKLRRVNDRYEWKQEGGYERYAKAKAREYTGPEVAQRI